MRFQPGRQRHKAYPEGCAWRSQIDLYMAPNPSFKALRFLSHMDLKKEVRKNSFSNSAFSVSFLQNKFINLCKQSPWPQALRNISFLFQNFPHLPTSKQPRETWPTPALWQSQKSLLASQDSCPVSFFYF